MEGGKRLQEDMTDIQKAMLETSSDQTMEIKLNVLNDTVELQRIGSEAPVSDEAIGRVLDSGAPLEPVEEEPAPVQEPVYEQAPAAELPPEPVETLPPEETPAQQEAPIQEEASVQAETPVQEEVPIQEEVPAQEEAPAFQEISSGAATEEHAQPAQTPSAPVQEAAAPAAEEQTTVIRRPKLSEPPQVHSIFEYRPRGIPTHILHTDVLQSALLSESEELRQQMEREERKAAPKRRVRNKKLENAHEPEPPSPMGTPARPSTITPAPRTPNPSPTSCGARCGS